METKALLQRLMAFRPVSADLKAVNATVDFLAAYLREKGVFVRVERLEGRKILYAATVKGRQAPLLLNCHLDVVPAAPDTIPYREQGGRIYGRGSGDCLGNAAVLAQVLAQSLGKAAVGVIFSTDEEIGGATTAAMLERGYRGDFILVMDTGGRIAVAQKGICTVKLSARGKACHSSTPWAGSNAIDRLLDGYGKMATMVPRATAADPWRTTLSCNVIRGGDVFNRVPDSAEMIVDIRYTESTSERELLRELRERSGLKVERLKTSPVVFCREDAPEVIRLLAHMKKAMRKTPEVVRMNGATDARHFARLGVPIIMLGVPAGNPHGAREWVSLKGLRDYEAMLCAYAVAEAPLS